MIKALLVGLFAVGLSACETGASSEGDFYNQVDAQQNADRASDNMAAAEVGLTEAKPRSYDTLEKVRTVGPAGDVKMLGLLPTTDREKLAPMASFIRQSGFQCSDVTALAQLIEDGKPLDMFKIDCASGPSYQVTLLNGKSFVKPWTGTLFG